MVFKRTRTNKEAKSLVKFHMKGCGFDDIHDLPARRDQYDGAGICDEPDCTWVCRKLWYHIRHLKTNVSKHKTACHKQES
jgi:hypothetical protein